MHIVCDSGIYCCSGNPSFRCSSGECIGSEIRCQGWKRVCNSLEHSLLTSQRLGACQNADDWVFYQPDLVRVSRVGAEEFCLPESSIEALLLVQPANP